MTRILIIDGHPDRRPERLGHALVAAYAQAAAGASHEVRTIAVAELDLPYIKSEDEFTSKDLAPAVLAAQADVRWAEHLVIFHPLWLGGAPAQLKGFFEQVFRYGFAIPEGGRLGGLLKGRTARTVVTMGMPAFAYSLIFGAFGVRSLERSVLNLSGIKPARHTLFGGVGTASPRTVAHWIDQVRKLGAAGA
jgi:putative NADPH-quinone reductase